MILLFELLRLGYLCEAFPFFQSVFKLGKDSMELFWHRGLCPGPAEGGCSAPGPALDLCVLLFPHPSTSHCLCPWIIPRAATQIPVEL